jgi:hypothetical protein
MLYLRIGKLQPMQIAVQAAFFYQLSMGSVFNNLPML